MTASYPSIRCRLAAFAASLSAALAAASPAAGPSPAQQQYEQLNALICRAAVHNLMAYALRPDAPYHCTQTHKAEFCRRLATPEGYALVAPRPSTTVPGYGSGDLAEGAAFCGTTVAQVSAVVRGRP